LDISTLMPSERLDEPKSDAENKGMAMAIIDQAKVKMWITSRWILEQPQADPKIEDVGSGFQAAIATARTDIMIPEGYES